MLSYAGSDLSTWRKGLVVLVESILGRRKLDRAIERYSQDKDLAPGFFHRAARAMRLNIQPAQTNPSDIPASGPLLVIANHPYGSIDGLAIGTCIERVRKDLRIIVWDAIDVPAPDDYFMALDLSDNGYSSLRQNVRIRRQAHRHLVDGGAILLFPSGSAERCALPWSKPLEGPWTALACKLAIGSKASVLPVFVEGHNSRLFHSASFLGDTVRRALFLHETTRLIGATIKLHFGRPLAPDELMVFENDDETMTEFLRDCVFDLDPANATDSARSIDLSNIRQTV